MSYYWGEPHFFHEIQLDGRPKMVTGTVLRILQQLAEDSPGLYWMDQICMYSYRTAIRNPQELEVDASVFRGV
jgi:hypothetical protein